MDCQDGSHAGSMVKKTGVKRTVGKKNNPVQGNLVRGQDGKWRVEQIFYFQDRTCQPR